jgi:hypothetical protein
MKLKRCKTFWLFMSSYLIFSNYQKQRTIKHLFEQFINLNQIFLLTIFIILLQWKYVQFRLKKDLDNVDTLSNHIYELAKESFIFLKNEILNVYES